MPTSRAYRDIVTFNWRSRYDERSLAYPVREIVGDLPLRSYSWAYFQLDQTMFDCPICGQYGACTGYSATTEAAARPKPYFGDPIKGNPPPDLNYCNVMSHQIYHRARQLDPWLGENYEGSSVLAATKAGVEHGYWREYLWALGPGPEKAANDVMLAIGHAGPVCIGSTWWDGMWDADDDEFLHASGAPVGGHAYTLTKVSAKKDAVWTPNNWGGEGQGWISRKDLIKLLDEDGEACVPMFREIEEA
jgi:hypothetical protein